MKKSYELPPRLQACALKPSVFLQLDLSRSTFRGYYCRLLCVGLDQRRSSSRVRNLFAFLTRGQLEAIQGLLVSHRGDQPNGAGSRRAAAQAPPSLCCWAALPRRGDPSSGFRPRTCHQTHSSDKQSEKSLAVANTLPRRRWSRLGHAFSTGTIAQRRRGRGTSPRGENQGACRMLVSMSATSCNPIIQAQYGLDIDGLPFPLDVSPASGAEYSERHSRLARL